MAPLKSVVADYLGCVYEPREFKRTVKQTVKLLKDLRRRKSTRFDAIAFRGSSGAALAFPVSAITGIPLIHVRKDDGNHAVYPVEGTLCAENYVILDDFVSSGETVETIVKKVGRFFADNSMLEPQLRAIVLYKPHAHGLIRNARRTASNFGCRLYVCGKEV